MLSVRITDHSFFLSANKTLVPIHCQVDADLSNFEGSWTLFESTPFFLSWRGVHRLTD